MSTQTSSQAISAISAGTSTQTAATSSIQITSPTSPTSAGASTPTASSASSSSSAASVSGAATASTEAKQQHDDVTRIKVDSHFCAFLETELECMRDELKQNTEALQTLELSAAHLRAHLHAHDRKEKAENLRKGYSYFLKSLTLASQEFKENDEVSQRVALGIDYLTGKNGKEKDLKKAYEHFLKSANLGHPEGMYQLASMYNQGCHVSKDEQTAFIWCQKAARKGNKGAMYSLGHQYENGNGTSKDLIKSFFWYSIAAAKHHPRAMTNLGFIYNNGRPELGIPKSHKNSVKAFLLYKIAASQGGYVYAMKNLADCYLKGLGTVANHAEGIRWLKEAGNKGDGASCYILGCMYENGGVGENQTVAKDNVAAYEWHEKGAKIGHIGSMVSCGNICNDSGRHKEALEYYLQAANARDVKATDMIANRHAFRMVANLYAEGKGTKQDTVRAIEFYIKAANMGDALSMDTLGASYFWGRWGFSKDPATGLAWLWRAADSGFVPTIFKLSSFYANGVPGAVKKDEKKACELMKIAANLNHEKAAFSLGQLYDPRITVSEGWNFVLKSSDTARMWYKKAAKLGNAEAMASIGWLLWALSDSTKYNKAFKWFKKAASQGNASGMRGLAVMYASGYGGIAPKDEEAAVRYWVERAEAAKAQEEKQKKEWKESQKQEFTQFKPILSETQDQLRQLQQQGQQPVDPMLFSGAGAGVGSVTGTTSTAANSMVQQTQQQQQQQQQQVSIPQDPSAPKQQQQPNS